MCNDHLALGTQESNEATRVTSYEKFIEAVEAALGHSLDGTQWIDGYSLDYARDFYNSERNVDGGAYMVADFVRNVNADKKLIELGEYVTIINSKTYSRYEDDDGDERRWDEVTIYVGKASDAFIERYVEERFPSERCQHEYDCCGQWYAQRPDYKRHGVLVILKQYYIENI